MADDKNDDKTVADVINASLVKDLDTANAELEKLRALLGRPVTVNVQSPDSSVLTQIGQYLPKLGMMADHMATIGGQIIQVREAAGDQHKKTLAEQAATRSVLEQVAAALERLIPEPPEGGVEPDDRFFHDAAGEVWDGRLCKKYGLVWECFDPGDADPLLPGDTCTAEHKVWRK